MQRNEHRFPLPLTTRSLGEQDRAELSLLTLQAAEGPSPDSIERQVIWWCEGISRRPGLAIVAPGEERARGEGALDCRLII